VAGASGFRWSTRWSTLAAAAVASLLGVACGADGSFPPPPGGTGGHNPSGGTSTGSGNTGGTNLLEGSCPTEGETRPCHLLIGKHADIVNCFNGVQKCFDGLWTGCIDGVYTSKQHAKRWREHDDRASDEAEDTIDQELAVAQAGAQAGAQAADGTGAEPLNAPDTLCMDPCDGTCHNFIETTASMNMGAAVSSWAQPTPSALQNAHNGATFSGLFPTGVDNMGLPLGAGAVDPHYTLTSTDASFPGPNALVINPLGGGWVANKPTSKWIGPQTNAGGATNKVYTYSTTFTLTGSNVLSASVQGNFSCDDTCVVKLNGTTVINLMNPNAWTTFPAFNLPPGSPFIVGTNTLSFAVTNTGGVTGVHVSKLKLSTPLGNGNGWTEPCMIGHNCEYGQYCSGPVTAAACTHDKCAVGPALAASCNDPCVTAVCAANPNCCTYTGNCVGHGPCVTGNGINSCAGDPAYTSVCMTNPMCCSNMANAWDTTCVAAYGAASGIVCPSDPTRAWDSSAIDPLVGSNACTDLVHDLCQLQCTNNLPVLSTCDHDLCATGSPLTAGCDLGNACVAKVCALNASCCTPAVGGAWTQACIDLIPQACQTACLPPAGVCEAFLPNQVDSQCLGADLIAGAACFDNQFKVTMPAANYVPVCNVGTSPTPMGATLVINRYTGGTGPVEAYPPTGTVLGTCTSTTQILPGKCLDVPCATNIGEEVFINPPGALQIPECGTLNQSSGAFTNNWSGDVRQAVAMPVTCDSPFCSLSNGSVRSLSSHMVIVSENSAAMPVGEWTGILSGFNTFFFGASAMQLNASGNAVEMGFFPDALTGCTATGGGSCSATPGCVKTLPGMLPLSTNATTLNLLYSTQIPNILTQPPYATALQGAVNAALADQALQTASAGWTESVVLVLGSDMTSNNFCGSTPGVLGGIAAKAYAQSGIRTFVIAVGPALLSTATTIANAGGGKAYAVANNGSIGANLGAALLDIETYSDQACSFTLPPLALFTPSGTGVKIVSTVGVVPDASTLGTKFLTQTALNQVTPTPAQITAAGGNYLTACLQACPGNTANTAFLGHGWCYDDPVAPTKILLCQQSCLAAGVDDYASNTVGGAAHSTVFYSLACPQFYGTSSVGLTPYQGDCKVDGTKPLWSWLAYNTTDPTAASVKFSFQTADLVNGACPAAAAFPPALPFSVTASQLSTTGQVCSMTAGTTTCPVDLVQGINQGCTPDPTRPGFFNCSLTGPALADCMNLTVTLNTNPQHTNTPTVNSFELRYSCPFVE
jgi:hypothetical protein